MTTDINDAETSIGMAKLSCIRTGYNAKKAETPSENANLNFDDLPPSHWAYEYVMSLVSRGVLTGISETEFAPDANVTREQFAAMLVRSLGIHNASAVAIFYDLPTTHWAYSSVASAANAGIITGFPAGNFGVGQNITRQEMAVMVLRAIDNGQNYGANLQSKFVDFDYIGYWAVEAVNTMQSAGIINGFPDGTFGPMLNATRAQAARIIYTMLTVM